MFAWSITRRHPDFIFVSQLEVVVLIEDGAAVVNFAPFNKTKFRLRSRNGVGLVSFVFGFVEMESGGGRSVIGTVGVKSRPMSQRRHFEVEKTRVEAVIFTDLQQIFQNAHAHQSIVVMPW